MHLPLASLLGLGVPELLVIAFILGLFLLVAAIPALLAFVVLSRVPPEHRKQSPGLAFLLLIPFFSLIWAFFVHPKVAESLRSYFVSSGEANVDDCGAQLALWLCICSVCSIVPVLGLFSCLAALVLLILFYAKAFELSARIPRRA